MSCQWWCQVVRHPSSQAIALVTAQRCIETASAAVRWPKVLEEARLVRVEPRGNRRLYSVRRDGLDELRRYLQTFWSDVLNAYSAEIARRMKHDPNGE